MTVACPDATPAQLYETVHSDWLFRMPSQRLAEAQHAGGGAAWLYELCWAFNANEGASHSLDVLLVFGTLGINDVASHRAAHPNAAAEVLGVAHRMRTDWVTFATTGNPGWPPYEPATRPTRVYAAEPADQTYPEERSRRLWTFHRFDILDLTD